MNELVERVNKLLLAGEPGNITKADTNGYVGYEPQAIIDSMNEGFGIGSWGFEELSSETVDNEKGTLAVAQVRVWLKDIDFKPFAWGQSRVTRGDTGDARKGAQTDAIKKALSYFSIGNRAYHGLLDSKKPTTKPVTSPVSSQVSNHPASSTQTPSAPAPSQQAIPAWTPERKAKVDALYALCVKVGECVEGDNGASFARYLFLLLRHKVASVKTLTDDELIRIEYDLKSREAVKGAA